MGIGYLSELGVEAMSIGYVYCSIAEPLVRVLKLRSEPPTMQCQFHNWLLFRHRPKIESSLELQAFGRFLWLDDEAC